MGHRLTLLLLALFVLPSVCAQDADPGTPPQALYLQDRGAASGTFNLTTYAPGVNATGARIQFISTGLAAQASWFTDNLPGPWNVSSTEAGHAMIFLSGLDEVAPVPDDPATATTTAPGEIRIDALVLDIDAEVVMQGTTTFAPRPLTPRAEVFAFDIDLVPVGDATFDPAAGDQAMMFRIIVSGRNMTLQNISPVHAHVASSETPAAIELPGFPYAAFRAWEDADRAVAECNAKRLRGEPCEEEREAEGEEDDDVRRSPLAPSLVVVLLAASWAARIRSGSGRT